MPGPSSLRSRRVRQRGHQMASNSNDGDDDDDVVVEASSTTCIDLTADNQAEEIIDLTRSHGIMESPVVVLTQADDIGPIRRRRGSGRLGQRRSGQLGRRRPLGRRRSGVVSPGNDSGAVHILHSDSDSDELPDVPFEVPPQSEASQSLMQSPEGVKISCPICYDDVRQIKRHHKQLMSTVCGHIFCNVCISTAIDHQKACPTCRKKLTSRSIHPVFL